MTNITTQNNDILAKEISRNLYRKDLWNRIGFDPSNHPKQLEIFAAIDSGARFIDVVAGTRSGKTIAAAAVAVEKLAQPKPEQVSLGIIPIIAPYGRLTEKAFRWLWKWVVIDRCLKYMPRRMSEHERYIEMPWGMRVEGLTADNPVNVKGDGWVFVILDEYPEMREDFYMKYVERGLMDLVAPVMRFGSPLGEANHWCRDWRDTEEQMIKGDKDYFATRFTSYDNPYLPEGEVARTEAKYKRQGLHDLFRGEYLGEFTALQGAIYKNFQETKDGKPWHVDDVDCIPGVPFSIGIDWGTDHPAVAIFCQTFGDRVNVVDMIYQTGMSDSEFARAVCAKADWWADINGKEVEGGSGRRRYVKFCYCDPSDPGGKKEFRSAGLRVYEQRSGIKEKINDRMYGPRGIIGLLAREDKPAIRIDRMRCKPLIYQLHNMVYGTDEKPKKVDRSKLVSGGENYTGDDAHDAFRYLIVGDIVQVRKSSIFVASI